MLTRPVATPARLSCIGLASVPVARPLSAELEGDLARSARLDQPLDDDRVHVRPAIHDRPAAEGLVAFLLLVDRGAVGGVRDIDGDADLRVDAEGGGLCAAQADLFLHRARRSTARSESIAP